MWRFLSSKFSTTLQNHIGVFDKILRFITLTSWLNVKYVKLIVAMHVEYHSNTKELIPWTRKIILILAFVDKRKKRLEASMKTNKIEISNYINGFEPVFKTRQLADV